MITLTKLDGNNIVINADEIETIESSFDSTISLKSGKKIIVKEAASDIIEKVIQYRMLCFKEILLKIPDIQKNNQL